MRTSLKKLRGLYKHGNDNNNNNNNIKGRKDLRPLAQLDELAQAYQDMEDMRDCYDSLLSAAAATANSSYEFSESLREMGACLLEKTAQNEDEDSGRVLLMLGKMQYELQKLVDSYRSHIFQTITVPSESLLNELRTVEEMKRQCDEKREVYEYMKARVREKGKSRGVKGESFSPQRLEMAREEYDEEATLFVFRLKSLKQGQSRSLLTQAARHHAAQLCFFKKALKSLEAVEPHVRMVTEQQHIDYHFGGLQDYDSDDYDSDDDDDDDDDSYDSNDDGELSFDYGQNDQNQDGPTSTNSMEVDQADLTFPKVVKVEEPKGKVERPQRSPFSFGTNKTVSQSAPITAETNKPDPIGEKLKPSLSRKFHSYVLPTPSLDMKGASVSVGSNHPLNKPAQTSLTQRTQNLWHSSPLEPKMYEKIMSTGKSGREKGNNNSINPAASSHDQLAGSDPKKIKRQAFSGPIPWPAKPGPVKNPQLFSGPLLRNPLPLSPLSLSPPKVSPGSTSPNFTSSPKINELHELPRPPSNGLSRPSPASPGPLVSRAPSPLPKPPLVVPRSFSIPSSSGSNRVNVELNISKPIVAEDLVVSPPLSPIALHSNN